MRHLAVVAVILVAFVVATTNAVEVGWVGKALPDDPFEVVPDADDDSFLQADDQLEDPVFLEEEVEEQYTDPRYQDPFEVEAEHQITFPFGKPLPDNVEQILGKGKHAGDGAYEHFNLGGLNEKTIMMDEKAAGEAASEQYHPVESEEADDGTVMCPFSENGVNSMEKCPHKNGVCCHNACCPSGSRCGGTPDAPTCISGQDSLPFDSTDGSESGAPSDGAGGLDFSSGANASPAGEQDDLPDNSSPPSAAAQVGATAVNAEAEAAAEPIGASGTDDGSASSAVVKPKKKHGMAIWMANRNVVTRDPAASS